MTSRQKSKFGSFRPRRSNAGWSIQMNLRTTRPDRARRSFSLERFQVECSPGAPGLNLQCQTYVSTRHGSATALEFLLFSRSSTESGREHLHGRILLAFFGSTSTTEPRRGAV